MEEDKQIQEDVLRDRPKSIRQIAMELAQKQKKKKEEKSSEVVNQGEDKKETIEPKEEQKDERVDKTEPKGEPKIDVDQVKKEAREEAERVAQERVEATKKEFQSKIDEILSKDKNIQEKQKEADELVASWEKEGRLPKDYPELISETMRIADAKMEQRYKAEKESQRLEQETRQKEETRVKETTKQDSERKLKDFQSLLASELDEIYTGKFLPRPTNIEEINNPDTKDEAAKQTQKVLQFGIKLNTERTKQNLPPVGSINKIYFLYYKPSLEMQGKDEVEQPGADAPISGAANQSKGREEKPDSLYIKMADGTMRAKTWAQIKHEELQALKAARSR